MATVATELVEQFKTEASTTGAGAVVYEAKDAEDANNYVLTLAQERNAKLAVKSKSPLAEQIRLREHLENAGIKVVETELGDWITQLAEEEPGHNDPTTHRTIEQVAELFSKATGEKLEPDPQILINAARRALREYYINADIGISEADIAIAETGTLVTLSNEGTDRLVAILPRIHVTMVNYEKLVPTIDDATARLESLSRDKTGRKMASYVTYLTGRNTTGDIRGAFRARAQGPEEEHIVLVDAAAGK